MPIPISINRCSERSLPCRPRERLRRGRKRGSGDGDRDGGGHGDGDASAGQPVLDLVLTLANPKGNAELYLQCFHRVRARVRGKGGLGKPADPCICSDCCGVSW